MFSIINTIDETKLEEILKRQNYKKMYLLMLVEDKEPGLI